MGVSCINLTCGKVRKKTVFFSSLSVFLFKASFLQSGGWLGCLATCLAWKPLVVFIYMEMDPKQGSELTCLNTSYLHHHLCKYRYPISATDPTNFHVSVVPAVNVILFGDNRACTQNGGGGRGKATLSPCCELNYF